MMTFRKFQRTKENFTCERCGFFVRGGGYTNHCPQCLWSKHVDVNPGDRQATCQGLMEPVGVELKGGEYTIFHRCVSCGFEKRNKTAKDDNFDAILKFSNRPIKQYQYQKGASLMEMKFSSGTPLPLVQSGWSPIATVRCDYQSAGRREDGKYVEHDVKRNNKTHFF